MAGVVKTLLLALTLVFALASHSRATPVSPSSQLNQSKVRFLCHNVTNVFQEAINRRAAARVKFDDTVMAWNNRVISSQCVGHNVSKIVFRSIGIVMLQIPLDDGGVSPPIQTCFAAQMTVIVGVNADNSMTVQELTKMEIEHLGPCIVEVDDGADGGTNSSGGNPQLHKQSIDRPGVRPTPQHNPASTKDSGCDEAYPSHK